MLSDKYRGIVMAELINRGDDRLMSEMAHIAARHLDAKSAIEVTMELKGASRNMHFGGAYTTLAEASPEALKDNYESCLAGGIHEGHREQSILALANYAEIDRVAIARMAFEQDPNTRVRGVSLLALAAAGPSGGDFEQTYRVAFADTELRSRTNVSYLVNALSNYARHADQNFLDSMTQELLSTSDLHDDYRAKLQGLRDTCLD